MHFDTLYLLFGGAVFSPVRRAAGDWARERLVFVPSAAEESGICFRTHE